MTTVTLAPLPAQPHLRLAAPAATAWVALCDAVAATWGWVPRATDAYRPYADQERIFRLRYTTTYLPGRPSKTWQGRRWYLRRGYAAAAVPGTSNHGRGIAVDVADLGGFTGARYRQLAALAEPRGWSNAEGRSIAEAWHWNYLGGGSTTDPVGGGPVPDAAVPPPPAPATAPGPASWEDDIAMDYLTALYLNLTGRRPDPLGAIAHLSAVAKGEKTWAQIAAGIAASSESKAFAALGSEEARNAERLANAKGWV